MSRVRAISKGAGAMVLLAAIGGGVPWALIRFVGWPLPHRLPSWAAFSAAVSQHGIPDTTLIKALACVVWLAWALLVLSLVVETYAAARGTTARRLAIAGPLQPAISNLVAAVVIAALSISPRANPAPARPLAASIPALMPPLPAVSLAAATSHSPASAFTGPPPQAVSSENEMSATTYVVQRNDTLWGIAERQLGDPLRWRDIYNLNHGRNQPGGATLTDPHWIDPGWTLLLPTATPPSATIPPADGPPSRPATPPPAYPPDTPQPSVSEPTSPETPATATRTHPTTVPVEPADRNHVSQTPPSVRQAHPTSVTLPSGSVIGASFAAGVLSSVVVGRLRRRHGYQPAPPQPGRSLAPPPLGPTIRRLCAALAGTDGEPDAPPTDQQLEGAEERRVTPDLVEIGERDGTTITARLTDLSGIAVCGPAADQVARAWICALLTRAGPLAAEVVATAETAGRLFGSGREPAGVRTTPEIPRIIRILEAEVVARSRLLQTSDTPDAVSYRSANPAEPLPALLFLFDPPGADDAPRIKHIITSAPLLGISVVFLADTPAAAARLRLEDCRVASVGSSDRLGWLAGARLFGLNVAETADILAALSDAEFRPTSETDPEWTETIERMEHPAPDVEAWPIDTVPSDQDEHPIRVCALGPLTVAVNGITVNRGFRSVAKELLVYFLLRPEGATVEQAVDHLWPDTDPKLVHRQFWTAASNLRSRLREWGDLESKILHQAGEIYRLDTGIVSADLWDFQGSLIQATQADGDDDAAAALRRAVDVYVGELAETAGWLWIESAREDLHRRAVDAHLRLAELEQAAGDLGGAQTILERVIDLDRYAEEPYRRLMALQAGQGRIDAVRAAWRQLQRRLLEVDLDPDPATARLYQRLVADDSAA